MKNISPSILPQFNGMPTKYRDDFLFEFEILCIQDGHKLKLFPTTFNTYALRWFMGLEDDSITTWDDMKLSFLKKYHD
jgi:hypothetical protein